MMICSIQYSKICRLILHFYFLKSILIVIIIMRGINITIIVQQSIISDLTNMKAEGLKGLVFGATGAIGAELVQILLASPKWSKVQCIARRPLQEWKTLPGKQKLTVEIFENLDDYFKQQNTHYQGFDSLFCCFGSQVKHGEETFVKVDKTYPLWAADIALKNKIPHYLLFGSARSNPDSWFLYLRTKGQVEEQLKAKKLNHLTLLRPGLLKNRRDARTLQKIFSFCPGPKIEARDSANVMRIIAEDYNKDPNSIKQSVRIFENDDMLDIVQKQGKQNL